MAIVRFVSRVGGNWFRADGPAYANARFAKSAFVREITGFLVAAERSMRHGWSEASGVQRQERYDGAS